MDKKVILNESIMRARNYRKITKMLTKSMETNLVKEPNSYEKVGEIIRMSSDLRTFTDLISLCKYLETTDLMMKFKKENLSDSSLNKLLSFCAINIQFDYLGKNKFLFKQGDYGDRFYIILKGKVNILKTIQKTVFMTFFEYLEYIVQKYDESHLDLITKCNKDNSNYFQIELNELDDLKELVIGTTIINKLNNIENLKFSDLTRILDENDKSPDDYGFTNEDFDFEGQPDNVNKSNIIDFILKYMRKINLLTEDLLRKEKTKLIIYDYEVFLTLVEGQYFGDFALENQGKTRTASVQAVEGNVSLGYITQKHYNEYLMQEKMKIRRRDNNFLLNFSIIKPLTYGILDKKYYSMFIQSEVLRTNSILTEKGLVDKIYFIKEGEVELSLKKTITEFTEEILFLNNLYKINFGERLLDEKKEKLTLNTEKNQEKTPKNNFKILIRGKSQIIGLTESYFNIPSLFNVTVISDKANFSKIRINDFKSITENETYISPLIQSYVKDDLKSLILRMSKIRGTLNDSLRFNDKLSNLYNKTNSQIQKSHSRLSWNIRNQSTGKLGSDELKNKTPEVSKFKEINKFIYLKKHQSNSSRTHNVFRNYEDENHSGTIKQTKIFSYESTKTPVNSVQMIRQLSLNINDLTKNYLSSRYPQNSRNIPLILNKQNDDDIKFLKNLSIVNLSSENDCQYKELQHDNRNENSNKPKLKILKNFKGENKTFSFKNPKILKSISKFIKSNKGLISLNTMVNFKEEKNETQSHLYPSRYKLQIIRNSDKKL